MALPVDRFVTPENNFEGLYRYSGRLEQNRLRDEQLKKEAEAKRFASDKFFANYLDPKDRFTGTKADPVIAEQLSEALNQAHQLSARGATDNEIFMAITPIVNRVNDYSQKAKQLQEQKKQALEVLGKQKGIDPLKFSSEFDDEVFMETDPKTGIKKMRDISTIDPSQNYADLVMKKRDIFTPGGFDQFLANSKPITDIISTRVTDARKGSRSAKISISAPEYMVPVMQNGVFQRRFEPRHELYTDNGELAYQPEFDLDGNPVIGTNGQQSKVPIKMVTKDDWNALKRDPSTGAYIRQEVRKYANKLGVDPSSPQAEHFGRALAWKILDESPQSKGTFSEATEQKAQPIIINNNSGSSKTPTQIDLREYPDEPGGGKNITDLMQGVKVTGLPNGKTLLAEKVVYNPITQRVKFKEYTTRDDDGKFIGGQDREMSLTTFLQNIKSNNPGTDMKFLDGLKNAITGAAPPKQEPKQKSWVVGGKSLTADQIKKGAAKYKMTEEQYLKSIGATQQ